MHKLLFLIVIFLQFSSFLKCQISDKSLLPVSLSSTSIKNELDIEKVVLPEFNIDSAMVSSKVESNAHGVFIFGSEFVVNYSMLNSGTFDTLSDGSVLWRLRVKSENALSLNFIFRNFALPKGSKMFIYNIDKSMILGAYSDYNNSKSRRFATELIKGDEAIIEYIEPRVVEFRGTFELVNVVHGFLDVLNSSFFNGKNNSTIQDIDCSKNVNCQEGDGWCREKRSTFRILAVNRLVSSVLLNQLNSSPLRSIVLTAFHAIDQIVNDGILSQAERDAVNNYVFYLGYYRATCSQSSSFLTYNTYSGAQFLSAWVNTDFALIELNNSLTRSDKVYYSGWAYTIPNNESEPKVTCLHFPGQNSLGMQISYDSDEASTDYAPEHTALGQVYWRMSAENGVNFFDEGSSGAPYFNEEHKVIGQHRRHSNTVPCNNYAEWGGKFSESWVGGGTDETSLHHWLAPDWTSGDLSVEGKGFPVYIYGRNHDLDITTITPLCDPANQDEFCVTYFNIDDLYIGGGCHNNYILPFFASIFEDDSIDVRNNTYTVPQYPLNLNLRSSTKIIIKPTTKINWGVNFSAKITCDNAPISASDDQNIYQRGCSAHDSCVWNWNNRINPSHSESEKRVSAYSVPLLANTLFQNIPNPFSNTTDISYIIGEAGYARIAVYNSLGQQVAELVNTAEHKAGKFNIKFEHSGLESGVYFYTLTCNNFVDVKKMMLIK